MKILHLCLCGPVTDGWTYQENMLSKYHVKLGHEVAMIASQWVWGENGRLKRYMKTDYMTQDGVTMIRLDIKNGDIRNKFKRYRGLYQALEKVNPDIIFMHGCQCLDVTEVVKYLRKNKVALYVDNHADFSNSATNWVSKNILHKVVWKFYAQRLVPYARKFYGVLPARVDFLKKMYNIPNEKCELLVMGADDEKVASAAGDKVIEAVRDMYHIMPTDFLVVTGGKIDNSKKQTLLLMQAVARAKNERIKLIVFGSVEEELEDKVKELSDGEKVKYIGWMNPEETYKIFAAADVVVFPGRHSVFWEQVAGQGIPLIVKDWPGTHHIDVGGNVRFLKRDDEIEIREMLEELVDNPSEYRKMKKVAIEKGLQSFSYKNIAEWSIR